MNALLTNATILAAGNGTDPVMPSWLNGKVIFGTILAVFVIIASCGLLAMTPKAHNQKTGRVAGGITNYLLIGITLLIFIGGGIIVIASGILDQYTNGVSTNSTGGGNSGQHSGKNP